MASLRLPCNAQHRQIMDRHKNMARKGETIPEMKQRLPFTANYETLAISKPYEKSNKVCTFRCFVTNQLSADAG